MLSSNSNVLLGKTDPNNSAGVLWTMQQNAGVEKKLTTAEVLQQRSIGGCLSLQPPTELAVTGAAFERLCATCPDLSNRPDLVAGIASATTSESAQSGLSYGELLLLSIRIFARTTPMMKEKIVKMHISRGLIVGMCGDGGNDCGALRAAHTGVALSTAEASVVSPFTAATKSVRAVVDLLREGRCALATSFAGYKFLITYGQIFPVVKLCCFYFGSIMPEMDYIMIDGALHFHGAC